MSNFKLKHLVIKPTLACTADCIACSSRKSLHKILIKEKQLSFDNWKTILGQAYNLEVERFDISGGEPTLYSHLIDLVKLGKKYGWKININSNGSLITKELAKKLLDAGLNSISISLYSPFAEIHDRIRNSKGLWEKAINAIRIFSKFEKSYPDFRTRTQTLLFRDNYKDFDKLVELHYLLGSNSVALAYLEGDFNKKYLLNEEEIRFFKGEVLPKVLRILDKTDKSVRNETESRLKEIFSEKILSINEWSDGEYQPERINFKCSRPQCFAIILSNGDVHPCNMVEYTHEPVMGNLFNNSLNEIWGSEKWNNFRKNLFDKCQLCPINLYLSIPLRPYQRTNFIKKIIRN